MGVAKIRDKHFLAAAYCTKMFLLWRLQNIKAYLSDYTLTAAAGNGIVISGSGGQLPSCPRFRCPFRCCNTGAGFSLFLLHSLHPPCAFIQSKSASTGMRTQPATRHVVGSAIFCFLDCASLSDWTQKYRLLAMIGRTSGGKLLGSYLPCWEGWRAKKPAP